MKKLTALILTLVLLLALPACTQTAGDRAENTKTAQHQTEPEKVLSEKVINIKTEAPLSTPELTPEPIILPEPSVIPDVQAIATQKEPEATVQPTKAPEAKNDVLISRDKAIEIALNKAGLTRSAVYDLDAELDKERNSTYWEVDFETRQYEYSYDIEAYSGKIVHQEKELND